MSDERPVCPSCNQELISYRDGCGVCGWQGMPVEVKQQGIILRDLGNQFEIALNDGSVGIYSKLYVYPSSDAKHLSSYPLEKFNKRTRIRTPSGTLYSYIATRRNKKGIEKQYQYWAYSYEVKDPETGQWKTKKKYVAKGKRGRVSYAIAQNKPVEYILSILDGEV